MTSQEFAQKLKEKYPAYKNIPDADLVNKVVAKYPVYREQVTDLQEQATQQEGARAQEFLAKSGGEQIFTKEFAQALPKGIYDTLVGNALKFVKSAVEAPQNIAQGIQGKPITSTPGTDPFGNPITSFQSDFQEKTIPEVLSGATSPLRATAETVGGTLIGAVDIAGAGPLVKGSLKGIQKGAQAAVQQGEKAVQGISEGVSAVSKQVSDIAGRNEGIVQTGRELLERAPRALKNVQEDIAEAGIRAEKLKTASPAVKQAIKANLDERIINTVSEATPETRQAYKEVLDIAEESPKKIGTKKQPTIVGGELATKQFDIIEKQKKAIGQQIGEEAKKLSKRISVNMRSGINQIDDVLVGQGVEPIYSPKGVKLDFSGSKYTPAERTKIQQLYDLATEGGDKLSPAQIRGKDQLFSKLKRESNFEGVGDIIVETPEGSKSLFNVFRDIYSSKLDAVSPQMKKLNTQYRQLSQLTDDIENSIFKTPNFEVTKSVDPAEFAKVNLRRIFGESQSSPVFEAVADAMDKASRGLGYKGATPKEVAEFAQEIRKLFPDTVPKTGFTGGIRAGLGDIIEKVSSIGTPGVKDQQKALRKLLDELSNK